LLLLCMSLLPDHTALLSTPSILHQFAGGQDTALSETI